MPKFILLFFISTLSFAQTNSYEISFENATHHEARIKATFPNVKSHELVVSMSRSSPGRYAVHEFAKNVYGFVAKDSKGNKLEVTRKDPYSWNITGHDGTVNVEYILFGNRADGTYSQIDNTHAHLNMPATFMYAEELQHRPIEITFNMPEDLSWKIATQLKPTKANTYMAPDLYYFMDSPTELSDFSLREFKMDGKNISFALHHDGTDAEFDEYFDQVKRIVEQEKQVFGELPDYDYGQYTFIACYLPNVSGDGMEHRNSTILTDTEGLAKGGMKGNIGTVSHEFFHSWNVERIRPNDLEAFDFSKANMSGSLWFAEGFTSYYTNLILHRAKVLTAEEYIKSLNGTFNYVWNSPAHQFFNPIEMSYQAPFVDAATSVDPVNRENTFISYYSYGSVLGLALDLELRSKGLNLDDFMKQVWNTFGKSEVSYTIEDLHESLNKYAGAEIGDNFFGNYIYKSEMPKYAELFKSVGLKFKQDSEKGYFGASLKKNENLVEISGNPKIGSAAYKAKLSSGDIITSVNGKAISSMKDWETIINESKPGTELNISYTRDAKEGETKVTLTMDPTYTISIDENADKKAVKARESWLATK
ncbi:putative metalloprotease with PDZ domain [Gillisia mitskevichiae]|uniref:Putative metalloprotease with PDZ domain n=1 Tax=Gillisia mitskevichiae TaxID=270921 RepID=A0A495PY85_9FLAO|nr:PDZ domain-containing protein [Gillisia mitskevichiae]RKS55219.1 putative metalloprotease with PDZ domain [Gillisia mitskevichiae]